MKWIWFSLGFLLGTINLCAQSLRARVVDADTDVPLAFVSIQVLGTTRGAFSDLDGYFELEVRTNDSLRFGYVGYAVQTLSAATLIDDPIVNLRAQAATLEEIVVRPKENPAWRIVRAALANRHRHDPRQYPGYQYQSYRKTIFTVDTVEFSPPKKRRKPRELKPRQLAARARDSIRQQLFLSDMHLWLTETVSQHYFKQPNQRKEVILAHQSSMPADMTAGINPIAFQPFGFYQTRIRLEFTRQDYVNPISPGCLRHYDYQLTDTLLNGADTTYVLQFAPLSGKYFVAMEGQLFINSDGYAIENVIASPADTNQLLDFQIRQGSARIDGRWFPKALETVLSFQLGQGDNYIAYSFGNRTFVDSVSLEVPQPTAFDAYLVERPAKVESLAANRRPEQLSNREQNTYAYWDSLALLRGPRRFLKGYNQLVTAMSSGLWGQGKFQLVVPDLLQVNKWERFRPGLGLRTGPNLADRWSLYAYAGYGIRDRQWKHQMSLDVDVLPKHDLRLRLSQAQDLTVPGQDQWLRVINTPWSGLGVANLERSRLDQVSTWRGELIWRPRRAWQLNPFYQFEDRHLLYTYTFDREPSASYRTQSVGLRVRWSPQEQLAKLGDWEAVLFPNFPVLDVQISAHQAEEISTLWWRLGLRLQHEFRWSYLGNTQIHAQAGAVSQVVPYPFLFEAAGGNVFFVNNSLQTAGLTEFTNQHYTYLFLAHRFGPLLGRFRRPYSRPELSLMHNVAWGELPNGDRHGAFLLRDLRHVFLESGIRVDNVLRIPYFKLFYIGVGGSAFYRWGAYHLSEWKDNWAFQLTVQLSV